MEGCDGVSRSVRARKKAIETQWLARALETGRVREDAALSFSVQVDSGPLRLAHCSDIQAELYPPDENVLQGEAKQASPRGGVSLFRAA